MRKASEVPVVQSDAWFARADRARIEAVPEAQAADSQAEQLEATLVVTNLLTDQIDHLGSSVMDDVREAFETQQAGTGEAKTWILAWGEEAQSAIQAWGDYQKQLVETVGRERAKQIAEAPASERMQQLLRAAKDDLRQRLIDAGVNPEDLDAASPDTPEVESADLDAASSSPTEMKTCPDCAEDVRAAARKCRFCGYRFDEEAA